MNLAASPHPTASAPAAPTRRSVAPVVAAVLAAGLIAALVPVLVSAYWLKTLTSACALTLCSLSVSLLYAQLGMVSLCQYGLLGVGGWFALRVAHGTGLPFEAALLAGGVAAAFFGWVAGLPALRMRGLYLAIVTLMVAGALQVVINAVGFPDGGPGILGRVARGGRLMMQRPLLAQTDAAYFRYAVGVVALCFLIVLWHCRSRTGRAWAMIRRGEACAVAGGVNIVAYKAWAFTLAGFLAGIAGGLLAGSLGQLDGRAFPASDSIMLFALSVVAGAYNFLGPIIAGLMLRGFPALLTEWGVDGNIATIVFGAGLLHALITAPHGISGQVIGLSRQVRARWMRPAGAAAP